MLMWGGRVLAVAAICGLMAGCGGRTSPEADREGTPVTVLTGEPTETSAAPEEPWRTGYKDFLTELCAEEAAVRDTDRPDYDPNAYLYEVGALSSGYVLYDIDKDGVPELLVRFGDCEAAYHTKIYTFRDGEMVLAGDLPTGHTSFYTWPGENAIALNWGHMGGHFTEKLSFVNGILEQKTVFEENLTDPDAEYTDMADIVPGSLYLWESRTTLGLRWQTTETGTVPVEPLILPIDDYGRQRTAEPDAAASETARAAIEAVLAGERPLIGVSADGFGGDTGEMGLADYLAPGGVDPWAESPQTISRLSWVDMDGNGCTDCVLALADEVGEPDQYVVLSLQGETVYAYCVNYLGTSSLGTDGVFRDVWGSAFALSFRERQCYQYTPAAADAQVPEADWQTL